MIEILSDLLRNYFNKNETKLIFKTFIGQNEKFKVDWTNNMKVNLSYPCMETCSNGSLFLFKSPQKRNKLQVEWRRNQLMEKCSMFISLVFYNR